MQKGRNENDKRNKPNFNIQSNFLTFSLSIYSIYKKKRIYRSDTKT